MSEELPNRNLTNDRSVPAPISVVADAVKGERRRARGPEFIMEDDRKGPGVRLKESTRSKPPAQQKWLG